MACGLKSRGKKDLRVLKTLRSYRWPSKVKRIDLACRHGAGARCDSLGWPNRDAGRPGAKAKWFEQELGFMRKGLPVPARQIVFDKSAAMESEVPQYGSEYSK